MRGVVVSNTSTFACKVMYLYDTIICLYVTCNKGRLSIKQSIFVRRMYSVLYRCTVYG